MKKKNSVSTLKTLSMVYGWMGLVSVIYLAMTEIDVSSYVGAIIRFIITLFFIYGKNNWRIYILISTVFAFSFTIFDPELNGFSLLDLAGNAIIFWYALRERK